MRIGRFGEWNMTAFGIPKAVRSAARQPAVPLRNGDRLAQWDFHRRYMAYPKEVTAELVGGIVYIASCVPEPHGRFSAKVNELFSWYHAYTPGVEVGVHATVILDHENEVQPDVHMRLPEQLGGQSRVDEDDWLVGAPELLAEIAYSRASIDWHLKKDAYRRSGVREYLIVSLQENEIAWFDFQTEQQIRPDECGVIRSHVFPGLWLNTTALLAGDVLNAIDTIKQGVTSPEHARFVESLKSNGATKI